MIKQKFRVGDSVLHRRSGQIYKVVDCVHNKPMATIAIKTGLNGLINISPTTMSEYFAYKLSDGRAWRFIEDTLDSATPCPNCDIVGWDWITGCVECGLSPGDAK